MTYCIYLSFTIGLAHSKRVVKAILCYFRKFLKCKIVYIFKTYCVPKLFVTFKCATINFKDKLMRNLPFFLPKTLIGVLCYFDSKNSDYKTRRPKSTNPYMVGEESQRKQLLNAAFITICSWWASISCSNFFFRLHLALPLRRKSPRLQTTLSLSPLKKLSRSLFKFTTIIK